MRFPAVRACLLTVALSGNVAHAEDGSSPVDDGPALEVQPRGTYIVIDDSLAEVLPYPASPAQHVGSHTLFLNGCWGGEVFTPGAEDSRNNRSSIISGTRNMPQYAYGSAQFDQVVACVRELMGPFNITVTDVDPGSTPHHEAVICGHPNDAGFSSDTGGVAPFTCGVIENSITYTFPELWGNDPRTHCEVVAQEAAHAWGLDHEFLCKDPMTYLTGCGNKSYQNEYVSCGEYEARACQCGGATQNSYQAIRGVFGAASPTPPVVTITEPLPNASVQGGFVVRAQVSDSDGVKDAALYVDDQLVMSLTIPPFVFNAPSSLADGGHEVTVIARDIYDTPGQSIIFVVVGEPCRNDDECAGSDVCVDGRCVAGPGAEGGLGEDCESGDDCASGLCGADGDGNRLCTEPCVPAADACPSGFDCKSAGDTGVCWPAAGGGATGGCAVASDDAAPWSMAGLLLLIGAVLLRRRRR